MANTWGVASTVVGSKFSTLQFAHAHTGTKALYTGLSALCYSHWYMYWLESIIIPCTHAQGVKWLDCMSVICCQHKIKITRSQNVGVLTSGDQCRNVINGEKAMILWFQCLDKCHGCYKSCFFNGYAYWPHLAMSSWISLIVYRFHCACLNW